MWGDYTKLHAALLTSKCKNNSSASSTALCRDVKSLPRWGPDTPLPSKDSFYLGAYWISESDNEIFCTENQPCLPWTTFLPENELLQQGVLQSSFLSRAGGTGPHPDALQRVKHEHRHSLQCAVMGFSFSAPLIQRQIGITNTLKGCGSIYPVFPVSFKWAFLKWWWISW